MCRCLSIHSCAHTYPHAYARAAPARPLNRAFLCVDALCMCVPSTLYGCGIGIENGVVPSEMTFDDGMALYACVLCMAV